MIALGVQPGQHVGLFMPTCPQFIEAFYGIAMAGAVAVPINARYQSHELAYLTRDADLVVLVTAGKVAEGLDYRGRVRAALPSLAGADVAGGLSSMKRRCCTRSSRSILKAPTGCWRWTRHWPWKRVSSPH